MENFFNDTPQNGEQKENKIEKPKVREGVDFVFEKNPELAQIGTRERYSEYIDAIFPDSKVKDIVYHASPNKFSEFNDPSSSGLSHIWFSQKPLLDQCGENIYSVLINIENPLDECNSEKYHKEIRHYEAPLNPEWINNYHITGEA